MVTEGLVPKRVVVDATVQGVGLFRGKMRISLEILVFKSGYPTDCTDFPEGMDQEVKPGDAYRLEMVRQNLVGAKGDGSKAFHYYWGIVGRSTEPLTTMTVPESSSRGEQQTPNGSRSDPAGMSIERQVAYKGAVEIGVAMLYMNQEVSMEGILAAAEKAATWIHQPPVAASAENFFTEIPAMINATDALEAEPGRDEQQEAFDELGTAPQDGAIGNLGEFFTRATQAGHGETRAALLAKLGVEKPVEILGKFPTYDAALASLGRP